MKNVTVIESNKNGCKMYGIEIVTENSEILCYQELSSDKESVEKLARNLDNSDISAVHINDIVGDFIIGESYDKLAINNIAL